jgi:hypothetical protein
MTDDQRATDQATVGTYVWHPEHAGKRPDQLKAELARQIESDQRAHRLVMEGAEESEHEALASVVSLERKWGPYDFGWAEMDADVLADRIVAFENEREARQELISWSEYRSAGSNGGEEGLGGDSRVAELSTTVKAVALIAVVLLIVLILAAVWAL